MPGFGKGQEALREACGAGTALLSQDEGSTPTKGRLARPG